MKIKELKKSLMKKITTAVIALTISIFSVSCSNNNNGSASTTDTTAATAVDTTAPPATKNSTAADTINPANSNASSNTGNAAGEGTTAPKKNKIEKVVVVHQRSANYYSGARIVSPAKTGNRNGIKSDIKADSIDNNAGFGAGK